jgi:hypothetical protein
MNKMILGFVFILSSVTVFASSQCELFEEYKKNRPEFEDSDSRAIGDRYELGCRRESAADLKGVDTNSRGSLDQCEAHIKKVSEMPDQILIGQGYQRNPNKINLIKSTQYKDCIHFRILAKTYGEKEVIESYSRRDSMKASFDGKITCIQPYNVTADFEACEKAIAAYSVVLAADQSLDLTQQVRTDTKNQQISREASQQAAKGDSQGAMFDSAIESNRHMKSMQQEKVVAYTSAVAALSYAHKMFPDEEDVIEDCLKNSRKSDTLINANKFTASPIVVEKKSCTEIVKGNKRAILANSLAKAQLFQLITEYVSKGLRAGLQMKQYNTKAQAIAAAKKPITDEPGTDMMLELCQANPQDPACIQRGNRVAGESAYEAGDFSIGNGANNSFAMNPESSEFGELGDPSTNLDDKNTVAGVNSPFADRAKASRDIINPAEAAQISRAGGGAGGGGAGGGSAGLGGSASLGNDLTGAEKEGDKEASIKTEKVSGSYTNASGGGFKGVSKTKDDANPFASLFDQKSEGGGVEEERSIASGDIDGKSSGLFEKISKRYFKIQEDKRVEAKNLE